MIAYHETPCREEPRRKKRRRPCLIDAPEMAQVQGDVILPSNSEGLQAFKRGIHGKFVLRLRGSRRAIAACGLALAWRHASAKPQAAKTGPQRVGDASQSMAG